MSNPWGDDTLNVAALKAYLDKANLGTDGYLNPFFYQARDFDGLPLNQSNVDLTTTVYNEFFKALEDAEKPTNVLQGFLEELVENKNRLALREAAILQDLTAQIEQGSVEPEDLEQLLLDAGFDPETAAEQGEIAVFQSQINTLNENALDQCIVLSRMDFLDELYTAHLTKAKSGAYYPLNGKIIRLLTENYAGTMSRLSGCENSAKFKNFTEKHLSLMVPKIRIYKTVDTERGEVDIPISFEQNEAVGADFFSSAVHRGFGVGLENFEWSYEGTNPATATKDVTANMTITANSFSELTRNRESVASDGSTRDYKIVELLLNPAGAHAISDKDTVEQYKIKVEVGWHKPTGAEAEMFSDITNDVDGLFDCLSETLYLIIIDHNIDIDELGRVKVGIEYRAYIEDTLESPKYNVLYPTEQLQNIFEQISEPMAAVAEKCAKITDSQLDAADDLVDDLEAAQEQFAEAIDTLRYQGFKEIVKTIRVRGRMFTGFIDEQALSTVSSMSEYRSVFTLGADSNSSDDVLEQLSNELENQIDTQLSSAFSEDYLTDLSEGTLERFNFQTPNSGQDSLRPIPFFFLGDLIDAAYDYAYNNPDTPNLKVILPSFPYRDSEGKLRGTSIANIPITLSFFTEWYAMQAIAKDIKYFPLMDFLRSITTTMVSDMLGRQCPGGRLDFSIRFQLGFLKGETVNGVEYFQAKGNPQFVFDIDNSEFDPGFLSLGAQTDSADVYNYLIIYPGNTLYLQDLEEGNEEVSRLEKDEKNGVTNFVIGSRTGFLQTISFSKNDIPGLREARLEKYGNTELSQLANVYNANLQLYGMPGFYPGQRVFINPFAMGLDVPTNVTAPAFQLGIGGYHIVIAVRSSISRGEYTTNVECRWESSDGQLQLFDGNTGRVVTSEDFVNLCRKELANVNNALDAVANLEGPQSGVTVEDSSGSDSSLLDVAVETGTIPSVPGIVIGALMSN